MTVRTVGELKEALPSDKYLNNLPLKTWDVAVGIVGAYKWLINNREQAIITSGHHLTKLCKLHNINISASEGVCILKEAARQWANK